MFPSLSLIWTRLNWPFKGLNVGEQCYPQPQSREPV
jgi:hypothetical protein